GQIDEGVTAEELVVVDLRRGAGAARDAAARHRGRARRARLVLGAEADGRARLAVQVHLVERVAGFVTDQVHADVSADHRLAAGVDRGSRRSSGDRRGGMESLPDARAEMNEMAGDEAADFHSVHAEPAVEVL